VILLSRDEAYGVRAMIIVAPATTTVRGYAVEVKVGRREGLPRDCVVNCDWLVTGGGRAGNIFPTQDFDSAPLSAFGPVSTSPRPSPGIVLERFWRRSEGWMSPCPARALRSLLTGTRRDDCRP